jgi:hypothetical protein
MLKIFSQGLGILENDVLLQISPATLQKQVAQCLLWKCLRNLCTKGIKCRNVTPHVPLALRDAQ